MLIEILGNSSSLLVVFLICLTIYFGIKAKSEKKNRFTNKRTYEGNDQ